MKKKKKTELSISITSKEFKKCFQQKPNALMICIENSLILEI
jgi:hypothetical protein